MRCLIEVSKLRFMISIDICLVRFKLLLYLLRFLVKVFFVFWCLFVVLEMTGKFMRDPIRILVKRDDISLSEIKQFFIAVEKEEWKFATLLDLYESLTITQAVIFCNTKMKVDSLAERMIDQNFDVVAMHGDMPQPERDAIMHEFRSGEKYT